MIISCASGKGGSGKTTTIETLCGVLCERNKKVAAIDCDANRSLANWCETFSDYPIHIVHELDQFKVVPTASELDEQYDVVFIDTAGAADSQAAVFAVGCSDFVIIPMQLSSADAVEAIKMKQLVETAREMTKRNIVSRVLFTDYKPKTVIAEHLKSQVENAGLEILESKLESLVAFKEMTVTGHVPRSGKARKQADALLDEVIALINIAYVDVDTKTSVARKIAS